MFCRIANNFIAIVFLLSGCKTCENFMPCSAFSAKAAFPWELEFSTNVDIMDLLDSPSDMKMMFRLRHPNLGGKGELIYFSKASMRSDTGQVEYIRGARMRERGWRFIDDATIGYYGLAGRISGQIRSMRSGQNQNENEGNDCFAIKSIDVGFKHVDFPTIDDCARYLAAYVEARPEDLAIGDNGVFVLVDCGKWRSDLMFIQIEMLAINGKRVPVELLKKYKQGAVEMIVSGQSM